MKRLNPMLGSDTYKQTHPRMYPEGCTKLVSYWVPRKSMLNNVQNMVFFGLQGFINEVLIEQFNEGFFNRPKDEVMAEYKKYMNIQIGEGNYDPEYVASLHDLGYLPLRMRAIPEGTSVTMGIPCIEVTNTHPSFAWLVQFIECMMQTAIWETCIYATIGHRYRNMFEFYYSKTVENGNAAMAAADFGMRGMEGHENAIRCSAAWLLSFNKTSTIEAPGYLDMYYNADCETNHIGIGAVSTEHSVMCANAAFADIKRKPNEPIDETETVRRLLKLYPNTSFSMVSDTWDYWKMVNETIPALKDEILAHNGKLLIRPDSGDMVEISINTIQKLWDVFGGTINSKGYKVLDPHIGLIYGDGCTLEKVDEILSILESKGYAANNIIWGIGAYPFHGMRTEEGRYIVTTRDTFGIAMKATYAEIQGHKLNLFKDPKTDTARLKKSHKGCIKVYRDENGNLIAQDGFEGPVNDSDTELKLVFENGKVIEDDFNSIRNRLNQF